MSPFYEVAYLIITMNFKLGYGKQVMNAYLSCGNILLRRRWEVNTSVRACVRACVDRGTVSSNFLPYYSPMSLTKYIMKFFCGLFKDVRSTLGKVDE